MYGNQDILGISSASFLAQSLSSRIRNLLMIYLFYSACLAKQTIAVMMVERSAINLNGYPPVTGGCIR